jgi:hypothetical protein
MEITDAEAGNGALAKQNIETGSRRQIWRIKQVEQGFYRFKNGKSGKTLEVKDGLTPSGTPIIQNDKTLSAHQQFKFDRVSGTLDYFYIAARHTNKLITVANAATSDLAPIEQRTSFSGQNQQWQVSEVTCPAGTLALSSSQIYTADGYRDGRKGILTWTSNAEDADYFTVEKLDKNGVFVVLDHINAKNITKLSTNHYYTYTDNQTIEGDNTYRIALYAEDAPPQYSNPITLDFKAKMDFNVYPNPTSEYIDVDLSAYENRPILLSVIDAAGHTVHFSSIEKAGKTQRVDLNSMATGQYILHIRTVGKRDVTRLFTVSK